jgi:hypothetical protein
MWLKEEKFWVGWGERAPAGTNAIIHTTMSWPPHDSSINTAVNTVYHIPMSLIFGPGIPVPPNAPPTLDIDVDEIRLRIVKVLQ